MERRNFLKLSAMAAATASLADQASADSSALDPLDPAVRQLGQGSLPLLRYGLPCSGGRASGARGGDRR
jgi:TAT (twin-arginine translocation) pathway signal sequence